MIHLTYRKEDGRFVLQGDMAPLHQMDVPHVLKDEDEPIWELKHRTGLYSWKLKSFKEDGSEFVAEIPEKDFALLL